MSDYDVRISVQVTEAGETWAKLEWSNGEARVEAPGPREAVLEALRQAPGDAAVDLGASQ